MACIDAHFDLGGIVYNRRKRGQRNVLESFYSSFEKGKFKLLIAAIFIETDRVDTALKDALLQIQALKDDIEESEHFTWITSMDDFSYEKINLIFSLEGAEPIARDLSLLNIFYDLGVRGLGLVWSRRNYVADGSYFRSPKEGILGGLTPFGIEVVSHAEKLGYFIDVSHLNDTGFEDVKKYATRPFIASHSNSRTLNSMVRNLTDQQIEYIGMNQGIIGVNAYTKVVSLDESKQNISMLCDHIDHIVKIAGDHVPCLGFDLCTPYYENGPLDVLKDHSDVNLIRLELEKRGYSERVIEKIFYNNTFNYLKAQL